MMGALCRLKCEIHTHKMAHNARSEVLLVFTMNKPLNGQVTGALRIWCKNMDIVQIAEVVGINDDRTIIVVIMHCL